MTAILALDLGTQTGFAVSTFDKKGVFGSGSRSFHLTRFDGGGVRFLRFRHFLNELRETCGPFEEIVYEEVHRHKGTDAAHIYGGFQAELSAWGEKYSIPYGGVGPGEWKLGFGLKGNAKKEDVIEAVISKGFSPIDDNEADAIAILLHHLKLHDRR